MTNDYFSAANFLDKLARRENDAAMHPDRTLETRNSLLWNRRCLTLGRDAVAFAMANHAAFEQFQAREKPTWTAGDEVDG